MQETKTVQCVFGCAKQEEARLIDREWCENNCNPDGAYERIQRPNNCFWHFAKLGLDMREK